MQLQRRPAKKTTSSAVLKIVLAATAAAAIILAGLWLLYTGSAKQSPEKVTKGFFTAIITIDLDAIPEYLCEADRMEYPRHRATLQKEFKELSSILLFDKNALTISKADITGKTATVPIRWKLTQEAAKTYGKDAFDLPAILVKEGSAWKIDRAKSNELMCQRMIEQMQGMP